LLNQKLFIARIFIHLHPISSPIPVAPVGFDPSTASSLVLKASCARIWSKAMRRLSRATGSDAHVEKHIGIHGQ